LNIDWGEIIMETNAYKLFHIARINDVLIGKQTPYNDHNEGISDCGNMLVELKEDKLETIFGSLFEIGLISYEQKEKIRKAIKDEQEVITINNLCVFLNENTAIVELSNGQKQIAQIDCVVEE